MAYSPLSKHCIQMKNPNGKPVGLMAAGSTAHMSMLHQESEKQEKENLLGDNAIDDKASAIEMSSYKVSLKIFRYLK